MNHQPETVTSRGEGGVDAFGRASRATIGGGGEVVADVPVACARSGIEPEPRTETERGSPDRAFMFFSPNELHENISDTKPIPSSRVSLTRACRVFSCGLRLISAP